MNWVNADENRLLQPDESRTVKEGCIVFFTSGTGVNLEEVAGGSHPPPTP